jgi:hypothetical protein
MNSIYKAKTDGETSQIGFKIQSNVLDAIKDGKAVLNVVLGKNGMEAWVQFLDPDTMHKTHDLHSASELIQEQNKDTKSATTAAVRKENPSQQLPDMSKLSVKDISSTEVLKMDIEEAERIVKKNNLLLHRTQGVLNKYPMKSLVINDFKRENLKHFVARAVCVANNIGSDKMLNRFTTDPRFKVSGVTTLSEWWEKSTWEQKLLSLTNAKDFDWSRAPRPNRISQVGFPFQEADLGEVADEEFGWDS